MDRLLYIVTKVRHEQSMSNRTITPKVQKRGLKIVPYCLSVCVCECVGVGVVCLCVQICSGGCAHVYQLVWRPEMDVRCLPP